MKPTIVAIGIVAILAFDLMASVASRSFGFAYARASIGSYLVYLILGAFAARSATESPIVAATATTAAVGLVESSVGWWLSWQIGPGRPASGLPLTVRRWITIAVMVVAIAAILGAVGGLIGRSLHGAPQAKQHIPE